MTDHHLTLLPPLVPGIWERRREGEGMRGGRRKRREGWKERGKEGMKEGRREWKVRGGNKRTGTEVQH